MHPGRTGGVCPYADGGAEELVADAIASRRDEVFLVDKVLPRDADRRGTLAAAERALRRLRTDRIDLYLLHWRGRHPLAETVAAFHELRERGLIRYGGVSNLDVVAIPKSGDVAHVEQNRASLGVTLSVDDLPSWTGRSRPPDRERRLEIL